ncbi:D-glutamate cyclase, mitochondrial isoform X2 [Nerophis lumbriciformis]|uniref:D-glutamate cyclase, mitochondrial isoform X2 n=1 Tax=Nerophis lumbriciformis TaxID=546530 RepID=UPI002AE06CB2|nr:D-glutamate cyclase, mitochondrial-like isoform X2 [Nerophis lumbriciformis]
MLTAVKGARLGLRFFSSNCSKGYRQAHLVILPKHLADDFEAFCHSNPAPLPLLDRRQWGDNSWPPLAKDDVIRMYQDGVVVENVSSLQKSSVSARSASQQSSGRQVQWSDMVGFYLGSSFGFEAGLKKALAAARKVSMYKTAVPCIQVGVFSCPLVVSMCPIPAATLQAAVQGTHHHPHGAPVHIGDADLLGIQDLSRPDYGHPVELQPADIPVFWACGVTAEEAIISSKPSLAFTHSPGSVDLTDARESSPMWPPPHSMGSEVTSLPPELTPLCFLISPNPLFYSLASQRAVSKIRKLEAIIGEDPGQRGIKALFIQDELIRSCLALSHASSVAITTGFPTHYMHSPPDETDGPPGAIAMATMLLSLGKKVTMVMDRRALEMNQAIIDEAVKKGVLKSTIPLVTFEESAPNSALHFLCHHGDPTKPRYDHMVAIERSGRAADGNYYNMRGINIKHLVDPIDDLFIAADKLAGMTTTGIGDGGNELGMGKVKEKVKSLMPKGELIACDVPADYAITAGVSNWGGYAVACGLYLLHTCATHQRYLHRGLGKDHVTSEELRHWTANLPSVDKEESILSTLVDFGIRSGKSGNLAMEVDGLTFHPSHSDIITKLLEVTLDSD